ncbi:hypothetical protein EW026_g4031 [Hermanssonia centrifuga]|uniref:Uncharacterized protein n=1 Tax=Hermanssonia centrifuga TaxID=98765 RepID=A0A4S4KID7_9APHY|nr:hypothetical protein EW026_g4031 [Hermanssonia centrifuga]
MFLSLLVYSVNNGDAGCAFVVAWGGMASQLARLLGLAIVILELKRLGLRHWEPWLLWGALFVALAFIFAENATNTGITSTAQGVGAVFCSKKHFLPTALGSSIIHFVVELYLLARLVLLRLPHRPRMRDLINVTKALSIARVLSLLIFDLVTVVPDAMQTNIFAQFIPFSIGALVVLETKVSHTVPDSQYKIPAGI